MTSRLDRGDTLIEVMITIVLLGTVVAATLTALSAAVSGTRVERDRSVAQLWLQSASEFLRESAVQDCNDPGQTEATIRAAYEGAVREGVVPPDGWDVTQLRVVEPVLFWDPAFRFQSECYDDFGFELQLVEIEVTAPAGDLRERVEVVIGGG
ncbi:MAG: type IV pilus modification PilV family protein [Ilumatobacteraceae bacterium]